MSGSFSEYSHLSSRVAAEIKQRGWKLQTATAEDRHLPPSHLSQETGQTAGFLKGQPKAFKIKPKKKRNYISVPQSEVFSHSSSMAAGMLVQSEINN